MKSIVLQAWKINVFTLMPESQEQLQDNPFYSLFSTHVKLVVFSKLFARLQTPLASRLSLLSIRGYVPDGSWQLTTLVGTDGEEPTAVTFTMPSKAVVLRFTIHEETTPDPGPDPVYYDITLPVVEGAATDPVAGTYRVKAWDSFLFYLTPDKNRQYSEIQE